MKYQWYLHEAYSCVSRVNTLILIDLVTQLVATNQGLENELSVLHCLFNLYFIQCAIVQSFPSATSELCNVPGMVVSRFPNSPCGEGIIRRGCHKLNSLCPDITPALEDGVLIG